jgi:hypothetical protein
MGVLTMLGILLLCLFFFWLFVQKEIGPWGVGWGEFCGFGTSVIGKI